MREALLLCCMITVKCIPSLILVICFLGPTVRNPVDGLQCLPLTSWTSCWWRTEWNTIKVYSLAKVLTLGLVKQQISIWTNTKAFIFQSLQSVRAKQFGGSSPQGAIGDRQGKSSTENHFRQVVLIRVSKVFRAHTGGRLAGKLILDLKARANNYQRAKRLSKKIAGKGEINHTWAAPVVEQMTLQMPPLLPPTHSSAENLYYIPCAPWGPAGVPDLCVDEGTQKAAHSALVGVQHPWWGGWRAEAPSVLFSPRTISMTSMLCGLRAVSRWAACHHHMVTTCKWKGSQRRRPAIGCIGDVWGVHVEAGNIRQEAQELNRTQNWVIPKSIGLGTTVQCKCAMGVGRVQSKQGARQCCQPPGFTWSLFLLQTDQPFTI